MRATMLVPGNAQGAVVTCSEGLSFWGGVDPDSGIIIDAHHPEHGTALAGRVVLMPTSRGSCSGSGVLLQLARNARAPAALVFSEPEDILTLGAMIAARLFNATVVVLRVSPPLFRALSQASHASIDGGILRFEDQAVPLAPVGTEAVYLTDPDRAMLDGRQGLAQQVAMEVLCLMAAAQGATDLVDVSRAHIDGCILAHDANLDFAEKMQQMGARVCIPTTINAISVDRENWTHQGVAEDFGDRASRLADAYVAMGAQPTFTCAPYLLEDAPVAGEAIGWSESNAVIYANSVLGSRTVKHPDYLDLFIAMTGRAPNTGVYATDSRRPAREIHVVLPDTFDDALWPMLGWLAGALSPRQIPVLTGLESTAPSQDDLKALCAAFGTTSAAPMLHVRGHTPEAHLAVLPGSERLPITPDDLAQVWRNFNRADDKVDLVAIGSPHASLAECRRLAELLQGQRCHAGTQMIVTVGRQVLSVAKSEGILERLQQSGVQVIPDLCWCSITEPVFPSTAKVLMTNSGKYSHYATGLTGRGVRFGSLSDCVRTAVTGRVPDQLPHWLLQAGQVSQQGR
ncbi:aconitase X [Chromatocurvus halotolerans]|uniref:Putative aconitase subunit 1 n=1 Tax=Chromatocurvus halotolerans TaxID=1132028 RepID=A0A4V2SAM3_9GAMM|nr:aconitase X [Chromatocurvus halotolerans]TCO72210.1 putative aconitase subunit 1 [Chromatocurvus halotolerans]